MAGNKNSGRLKIPTALKMLNGSAAHDPQRINKNEPKASTEEPRKPRRFEDDLDLMGAWNFITSTLRDMGILSKTDLHQIICYCDAWKRLAHVRRHLDEIEKVTGMYFLKTAALENKLRTECCQIHAHMGMTPTSRPNIEGPIGKSKVATGPRRRM